MSEHEIFTRVQFVVAEQLVREQHKITKEAKFAEDLGADYLDVIELIMALEDAFDTEIPDEESEKIATVQQAVDYISHKKVLV